MNECHGTGCRICLRAPSASRKRLRCSDDEVADVLVSLSSVILNETQLAKTKRIKAEVECISAELDAWAERNFDFTKASDEETNAYQQQGAALMQRLNTCDRDLQFVQKMARWESARSGGK